MERKRIVREIRAEMFGIMAECFREPSESFIEDVNEGILETEVSELLHSLNITVEGLGQVDLEAEYYNLFVNPQGQRLVPVESIYRPWTISDEESILGKTKGYLMSDWAMHLMNVYEDMGIELPAEYQSKPDHLTLELEFMALLLQLGEEEVSKQFFRDHLDWLGDLFTDVKERYSLGPFYTYVFGVLEAFWRHEKDLIG